MRLRRKDTLAQVRKRGSDGCVVQADVTRPEPITEMFRKVQGEFGKLDIFVSNARPDLPGFYRRPLDITVEQWHMALDSQARAFLLGAQESARIIPDGGRILAITYSPGGRTGSWQPWVAMGAAKAAMDSLVRYFAVALALRGITVNGISPGGIFGPPNVVEGGVLRVLPQEIQEAIRVWHEGGWTPMGRLGTPEDVGNAVMLLCMDEASFITGQILHVDGGLRSWTPSCRSTSSRANSACRERFAPMGDLTKLTQRTDSACSTDLCLLTSDL